MRGGRGEVDVRLPVGDAVAAAVVAGRHCGGDTQRGRVGEGLVECGACLGGPLVLRLAPADADHGRGGCRVGCRRDGVEEAGVGVGCEVDEDVGSRGERARHFDVEHHLAVCSVGVGARLVGRSVDTHGRDRRPGDPEAREVGVEVALLVTAAQFDDRDGLPAAVRSGRELVHPPQFERRIAGVHRVRHGDTELRARLRTVVQPEDGGHHILERGGDAEAAGAMPMLDRGVLRACARRLRELGSEDAVHQAGGPGDPDATLRRARLEHGEPEVLQGGRDELQVVVGGAELRGQLLAAAGRAQVVVGELCATTQDQRRLHRALGVDGTVGGDAGRCFPFAAGQRDEVEGLLGIRGLVCIRHTVRSTTALRPRTGFVRGLRPSWATTCGSARTRTAPAARSRSARRRR